MNDLIERLEKATGPDRGLDGDIAVACSGATGFIERHGKRVDGYVSRGPHDAVVEAPSYTASIDAALTLLPEDVEWQAGSARLLGMYWAEIITVHVEHKAKASSPALALCIAALKARAFTARPVAVGGTV